MSDQVGAYQEMALFGMSAMAIAKRTSSKLAVVGDALKVAKSPVAIAAVTSHQLTLDQAITIVEFEDDVNAVEQLTTAATRGDSLDHLAQRLRDDGANQAARNVVVEEIALAGITLIDSRPSYDDATTHSLGNVFTDSELSTRLTEAAAIAEGAPDLRAYPALVYGAWGGDVRGPDTYKIAYAVTNCAAHGWFARSGSTTVKTPITDEIRSARRQAKLDKADWMSASVVREEWIRNTLLPSGVYKGIRIMITNTLIAHHLVGELLAPNYSNHIDTAARWLGAIRESGYDGRSTLQKWLAENPTKPHTVALAIALAGMDDVIAVPKGDTKGWDDDRGKVGPYLQQLEQLGYTLSDSERAVVVADQARAAKAAAKAAKAVKDRIPE